MKTKYDFKSIFKNKLNSLLEKFHYNVSEIDSINIDIKKIKKIKNNDEQLSSAKQLVQKHPNDPKVHFNFTELLFRNFNKDWIPHSHEYAKKRTIWIKENNLENINMEFIGSETVNGSLGNHITIEGLVNANNFNLRPKKNITLLLPEYLKLRNKTLFSYFKPHINVISKEKIINTLKNLESYLSIPMGFLIPLENKSIFHEFLPAIIEQKKKENNITRPFFILNKEDKKRGEDILKKIGIKNTNWHVTLHVREPGYRGETKSNTNEKFRNSNINNFIKSIKLITDKGGWVFRMGDPSMQKLPKMNNVVDYAHSNIRSEFMDVYLGATSKFCIGTPSGYYTIPSFFGVPVLLTNLSQLSTYYSLTSKDIFIPRFIKQKNTDKYLNFNELLSHPYLHFYSDKFYEKNNLVTEENKSEDITDATQEIIERVFKEENNQQDPLQSKFKNLANKNIYSLINQKIICNANIGSRFINKYQSVLM